MTKYKLTKEFRNPSQITLTSFMVDGNEENEVDTPMDSNGVANEGFTDVENGDLEKTCKHCKANSNTVLVIPNDRYSRTPQPTQLKVREWIKQKTKKTCTRKLLYKRIPILSWLPQYTPDKWIADLLAGTTVGLTVIPQAIAYSNVAGLPPQIGLYSSFMACFVYAIFGSCKDSPIGPTAISALLVRENIHSFGVDGAVFLCFITGCVQMLMGLLQLGFLIDFISGPVSIGFTSAAAIIIATTQVKDLLGLNYPGGKFLLVWEQIFEHVNEARLWDCFLGFCCMSILLLLRKAKDFRVGPKDVKERKRLHNIINTLIWLISTSRNIIVVICCASMAYIFDLHKIHPFILSGYIKPGLPHITPPPFHTHVGNTTYNFIDIISSMGGGILVVPLFGILENIALAKAFSNGRTVDATQEMLALGFCNLASSFVNSMPVTGGLSRGAVNNASGVKTTFGGVYTGLIVIIALCLLTPWFSYIPKASLAAVIIAAVVSMVELHVVKPIWRTKKSDLIPAIATFLSCLFLRLEVGIVIGIGINLISLLYASARPTIHVENVTSPSGCEFLLITPDRSLVFPSVDYVRALVLKAGVKQGSSSIPVVIDAKHIHGADFTAAKGIKSLIEDFIKRKQLILFYNLKPSVIATFQGVQPKEFVYCNSYNELNQLLTNHTNKNSVPTVS